MLQADGYIPGTQVVCVTGAYTSGGMQNVIININRSGTMATHNPTSSTHM